MAVSRAIWVVADEHASAEAVLRILESHGFQGLMLEKRHKEEAGVSDAREPVPAALVVRMAAWTAEWSKRLELIRGQQPRLPLVLISPDCRAEAALAREHYEVRRRLDEPVIPGELCRVIHHILDEPSQGRWIGATSSRRRPFSQLIMASASMQRVLHQAERAAQGDCPVLLLGEEGTGRRLIAELVHGNSERRAMPFVRVHLAPLTSAVREISPVGTADGEGEAGERPQADDFLAAEGGSLFIDEISSLSRTAQARLLWVLEKRRIATLEDEREREVDVRLIAASSHDLDELVAQGRFRADLNYRLNVVPIHLPPLRERREDIAMLTRHFLEEICVEQGLPFVEPEPELMQLLEDYDWPGNVRQLHDCLRSMVCLARTDRLTAGDLCPSARRGNAAPEPSRLRHEKRLAELERLAMVEALEQHGGNRTCAAEALGISVRTLQRKLKKWNAERGVAQS